MSLTKIYQLYAVKCGSTLFQQLSDGSINTNVQDMIETPVGFTMPLFNAANGEKQDIPFTTGQIETALGLFGVAGGSAGISIFYGRKILNLTGPVAVGTAGHATWTAAAAHGVINAISAGNRKEATAQVKLSPTKSGSTANLIYSGTAACQSYTTAAEHFVLGPIAIGGTIIEGTNDFSLSFNPAVEDPDDDYSDERIFCATRATQPVISFTSTDSSVWSLHNTAYTNAKANLIKMESNLRQTAAASLVHILFGSTSGRIKVEGVSGTKHMHKVSLIANSPDGVIAPVTATTLSAITTA